MKKKTAIGGGVAAVVLGGGLALTLTGGGSASAARTPAQARAASHAATASPATTAITRSQAEALALKAVGGGQVREVELEREDGVTVWSVDVTEAGVAHDVEIDARTGTVLGHERDAAGRRADDRRDRACDDDRGDDHGDHRDHGHDGDHDDHDDHDGGHRGPGR
jgi:hypothetical protein